MKLGSSFLLITISLASIQSLANSYLVADLGYSNLNDLKDHQERPLYNNNHTKGSRVYNFVLGWQFSPSIRTDLKISYRPNYQYNDPSKHIYYTAPQADGSVLTKIYSNTTQKISASTALLNLYYDFDSKYQVKPYFMAGLGIAYVRVGNLSLAADLEQSTRRRYISTKSYLGRNQTNFAWNLGVGSSYALTKQCILDLGYRYVNLGKSYTWINNTPAGSFVILNGKPVKRTLTTRLTAHEVTLGLRYQF